MRQRLVLTMKGYTMKFIAILLTLVLAQNVLAQDRQKSGGAGYEGLMVLNLPTGPMLALRALPVTRGTHYLDVTFKLKDFDATDGAHLALGLGDLYRYFDRGLVPVADGFVVGKSALCPEKGVAVNFESYGGEVPGKVLDCPTAYGPLRSDTVYQVRFSVTDTGVSSMTVHLEDDTLVWGRVVRTFNGMHAPHARGLFLIPYSPPDKKNGAYELLRVSSGVEPF